MAKVGAPAPLGYSVIRETTGLRGAFKANGGPGAGLDAWPVDRRELMAALLEPLEPVVVLRKPPATMTDAELRAWLAGFDDFFDFAAGDVARAIEAARPGEGDAVAAARELVALARNIADHGRARAWDTLATGELVAKIEAMLPDGVLESILPERWHTIVHALVIERLGNPFPAVVRLEMLLRQRQATTGKRSLPKNERKVAAALGISLEAWREAAPDLMALIDSAGPPP